MPHFFSPLRFLLSHCVSKLGEMEWTCLIALELREHYTTLGPDVYAARNERLQADLQAVWHYAEY